MSGLHHRKPHDGEVDPDAAAESGESSANPRGNNNAMMDEKLGEYPALDRYISTYREEATNVEDDNGKRKKKPWWKFWQFQSDEEEPVADTSVPDNWIETDIHSGIRTEQVADRRKLTGWNELAAEKENMLAKFLGFFTGPILYGTSRYSQFHACPLILTIGPAQSWKLLLFSPSVWVTGLTLVSFAVFWPSTPLSVSTRRSRLPMSLPVSRATLPCAVPSCVTARSRTF